MLVLITYVADANQPKVSNSFVLLMLVLASLVSSADAH